MRADQALAASNLFAEPGLQCGQELGQPFPRARGHGIPQPYLSYTRQCGIEVTGFPLESRPRLTPPADQLEPHSSQLLVPRRQRIPQRSVGEAALQEIVPAREDLPVAAQNTEVGRVQLAREHVA